MSIKDLYQKADITKSTLWSLFQEDANPRLDTLQKIAGALGVSIGELFDHQPNLLRNCGNCKRWETCRFHYYIQEMEMPGSIFQLGLTLDLIIALANKCDSFELEKEEG